MFVKCETEICTPQYARLQGCGKGNWGKRNCYTHAIDGDRSVALSVKGFIGVSRACRGKNVSPIGDNCPHYLLLLRLFFPHSPFPNVPYFLPSRLPFSAIRSEAVNEPKPMKSGYRETETQRLKKPFPKDDDGEVKGSASFHEGWGKFEASITSKWTPEARYSFCSVRKGALTSEHTQAKE